MNLLKRIFTWWDGATIGTQFFTWRTGARVGVDTAGNVYYRSKQGDRRWVIYNGPAEGSRVPPEWHGWLHYTSDTPGDALPAQPVWTKPHIANPTGSDAAYKPKGALDRGGGRAAATGDYQAWKPE